MTEQQPEESLWSDFEPDELIPESDVPRRAKELARLVDCWFSNYVEYVDPFNWREMETQVFRNKAFFELSGYLLNARGVSSDEPTPEIHDLIIERVNDSRYAHMMLRSPRELNNFAWPFLYAYYVGELEDNTAKRLQRMVETGAFWEVERVPYRQIEYCYLSRFFSEMFGYSQDHYDEKEVLENSILNHQPNVVRTSLPDAYCLTHNIFFYDNHLGVFPEIFPNAPAPYDSVTLLRGLILRFMAAGNCDIVLELVLSGVLQRELSRQMVQFVISWILDQTEDKGYVPGPDKNKTALMNSLEPGLGFEDEDKDEGTRWNYDSEREETWGKNFHVNTVAGMTARVIARDWETLHNETDDFQFGDPSYRRDVARLGQILHSLGEYDLKSGAQQIKDLATSPVVTDFEDVLIHAVDFLEDQRTLDGEFGYWTNEELMYTNSGATPSSFHNNLVKPISRACEDALEAIEPHLQ